MSEEKIIYDPNEFVIEDGVLLQYLGNKTTVKVPEGVTEISAEAFLFTDPYGYLRNKNIINLYLPESVKEMKCSFANTKITKFEALGLQVILGKQFEESSIETVNCPNAIQVNNQAFYGCEKLKNVNLPKVQLVGSNAFYISSGSENGSSLRKIDMPNLVTIMEEAFRGCACTEIHLPKVKTIGERAFYRCENLEKVDLPNATEFYDGCFEECRKLKTVKMPKAKPKNYEFCPPALNGLYFSDCDSLQSVKLGVPWNDLLKHRVIVNPDGTYQAQKSGGGCYVATCVYGSYDCPEVWTLRRFRDYKLSASWYGRLFIKLYYATSPTLVKWFGNTNWFKNLWQGPLNNLVLKLNSQGYEDTPYND